MNNKKIKTPEHVEQVVLFEWARLQSAKYPMLKTMFAIPNGGKRGSATAAKLKAEGVKAGVCDIFLPYAASGCYGLFIEMKRTDGGRVSDKQKIFINDVRAAGYAAEVCKGFDDARETILKYITNRL